MSYQYTMNITFYIFIKYVRHNMSLDTQGDFPYLFAASGASVVKNLTYLNKEV